VNGSGVLEVEVTATSADSTLSKVVELVRSADQAASRHSSSSTGSSVGTCPP
jgi:cation transport ATPase